MMRTMHYSDINECLLESSCINADCFNQVGSFSCTDCNPGFARDNTTDIFGPCGTYVASYIHTYVVTKLTHFIIVM